MRRMLVGALAMAGLTGAVQSSIAAVPGPEQLASGQRLFQRNCRICHAAPFTGFAMLARRLGESQADLEQRGQVDPFYVRFVVRNGLNSMPHIGRGSVSDDELTDIIAWLNRGATPAGGKS